MCAYFSKSEDKTSEAMKQAAKEAVTQKKEKFEQMKAIARAYITKREYSVKEAVYHIMPELWLEKLVQDFCLPIVTCQNTDIKCFVLVKN